MTFVSLRRTLVVPLLVCLTVLTLVLVGLSSPVTAWAAPTEPAAPTATTDGQSVTVVWTAPDGEAVDGYRVELRTDGPVVASYRVGADVLQHTFAGLDDGTYTATVTALGADGSATSPASGPVSVDLDLLAAWRFAGVSPTAGSAVPDASGNGHPATLRGAGASVAGDALTLPGGASGSGASYVELPTGLLNGQDTVTVSAWLKNDTGSGNYAAMFFGTAQNPPSRYWLLNPKNGAGLMKTVVTTGTTSTTAPWGTETGISPTTATRGVAGPVTAGGAWGLYTTVIEPTRITGYYNGVKVGSVAHTTTLSSFGTNLVGYIGRSSYPDAFYKGGVRDVRVYTRALSDATVAAQYAFDKAEADAAALSLPTQTASDLELPTAGVRLSQIDWSSSHPEVVSTSGTVVRPTTGDVDVTLTAVVSQGGRLVTREFTVTVLADDPEADVARVAAAYDVAISEVTDDLVLKTLVDGVDVAWSSSAPEVLADDGTVTRPEARTPVTLTATFSRAGFTQTRDFGVHVLPADAGRIGTYLQTGDTNRTDAVHLAHAAAGDTTYAALNNGRPVRFADSYTTKLGSPVAFRKPNGKFGLVATVNSNSSSLLVYDSADLVTFTNQRLVSFNGQGLNARSVTVAYDNGIGAYRLTFVALGDAKTYQVRTADFASFSAPVEVAALPAAAASTFPSGAIETSSIGVTAGEYDAVLRALTRMHATGVQPLDEVTMVSGGSLKLPKGARVTYSNGGADTVQPVDWDAADVAAVDTDTPGTYVVDGTVGRTAYPEKLAHQRADPDVTKGDDGQYYLTASYPQVGTDPEGYDRVVLRRASTIAGLTDATEVVLWDEANSALQRYVWAPELTKINGTWHILFTASRSSVFDIRPMMLRHTGGDLMDPANWVELGAMLPMAGDRAFNAFSLDMTYFEQGGRHYVIWAQSAPSSALLMAEIDPENPRQLISPARTIAYPDLAWEGNTSTNQQIDEGAAVIKNGGKVYVTFSASTVDDKYSVGLLTADQGADLLDPASWTKTSYPLLATADLPAGQTGPGHNSFTVDELGNPVIVYHARTTADTTDGGLTDPSRHARARTVHFDATGAPVLNVTAEEELPADRAVSVTVVVADAPIELPGAAGAPVVSQRSSTGAVVTWTAPTQDGGADIAGYRVRVTQDGTQVSEQEVSGTSVSLTGLAAGESYAVTVEARNAAGYGPATAAVEFTTLVLPAPLVHYPLAEDLQETVGDRDATAVGTVTYDDGVTLPGGSGSSTNYVKLPDDLLPTASPDVSVSVWIKSDTPARNGAAIGFGTAPVDNLPANYWLLNPAGPNGNARSAMTNGVNATQPWTTEVQVAGPNTTARRGSWVNYTTVFTAGTLTSYVDGVRIGSVAKTRTFADFAAAGTVEGYLGRSGYLADSAFKGSFRELRVYDSALSNDQVRVLVEDDAFILESARTKLSLGDTSAVTEDLTLPTALADGVTVGWASSDASVVSPTGVVTVAGGSRTATLTATLTRGTRTATREFEVTVLGRDAVVAAAADLLVAPSVVASGDALPVLDAAGITTTWTTSSPGLTVADGAVSATQRTTGTVTAVVAADGAPSVTKAFEVTVLPADQARFLLGYTRTPLATQTYSANLAHGLHLALGAERAGVGALHENNGVLYAKAVPTAVPEVNEVRTLIDPYVFRTADGEYGVVATRTLSGGSPDGSAATSLLLFTSPDLRDFTEVGLLEVDPDGDGVRKPRVLWDSASEQYVVAWETPDGTPRYATTTDLTDADAISAPASGRPVTSELPATTSATGAVPGNTLVVDAATARALRVRFGRIQNTAVTVDPVEVSEGGTLDLADVRAQLAYDDGSDASRAITWDQASLDAVDTTKPGEYTVTGTVKQTDYAFPFVTGRADPAVIRWKGRYLFIATTEAGQSTFLLRSADTIAGLRSATDRTILSQGGSIPGPLWAPEFHVIQGELYVFFASGVDSNCWCDVQAHVMKLEGDDPEVAADWGTPVMVQEKDGGRLQLDAEHPGISLDMTYWEDTRDGQSVSYVSWSQRYIAGGVTGDAQLWIATVDPADPARLTSDPVLFTAAEFGWDHNTTPVVEAPYVTRHGDTLYLTYSGSATDSTYVVGLMTAPAGADLLDPDVWTKHTYPVLKSDPATGQLGPGHSMFAVDEDGNEVIVYHARNNGGSRDAAVRRIHWAADGMPVLDMTADEEVAPANRSVSTTVTVKKTAVPDPDTTAPEVSVQVGPATPDGLAGWYTGAVSVSASATDDRGAATLEVRLGSGAWTSYDGPVAVAEGVTELGFRATDAAGNVSTTVSRTIKRDATAPVAAGATAPAQPTGTAGWFRTLPVRFALSGTDADSGVAVRELRIGSGAWRAWTSADALPVGVLTVQFRVADAAGNVSATRETTVRIDPVAPTLRLSKKQDRSPKVTVTAVAADSLSGLARLRYRIDGGRWRATSGQIVVRTPGKHTVQVQAFDRAGNTSAARIAIRVRRR